MGWIYWLRTYHAQRWRRWGRYGMYGLVRVYLPFGWGLALLIGMVTWLLD